MKKILTTLVLGSLLIALVVPMVVSAQGTGPKECCRMKIDASKIDPKCTVGSVVGPRTMSEGTGLGQCPDGDVTAAKVTDKWSLCCLVNTIYVVTSWAFYILTVIAVVFIIAGAFVYMTAAGDPNKTKIGKGLIVYTLIGLAIGIFARIIPAIVTAVLA